MVDVSDFLIICRGVRIYSPAEAPIVERAVNNFMSESQAVRKMKMNTEHLGEKNG